MATQRDEAPVLFLLRLGIGALWLHDGLVFRLLAPELGTAGPPGGAPALAWANGAMPVRVLGAAECVLGLLLLLGVGVRLAATLQCGMLLLLGGVLLTGLPRADRPLGILSMTLVLLAASAALALVPARGRAVEQEASLAPILRLGLGLMWLYEGLARTWLLPHAAEAAAIARAGLVPAEQALAFVHWLGGVEAVLGVTLLLGIAVRGLAVLQVGLLAALTALGVWIQPQTAVGEAGLSRHLAAIGCALVLYQTGAGRLALGAALGAQPGWRRQQLRATLRALWGLKVAMLEAYRLQEPVAIPSVASLLQKLAADDLHHGEDVRALLHRHGARSWPIAPLFRAAGWLLGVLTVIAGRRAALRVDLWAKTRVLALYARAAEVLPPEEGITARALQAMLSREQVHHRLLHEALGPRGPERGR